MFLKVAISSLEFKKEPKKLDTQFVDLSNDTKKTEKLLD